METLTVSVKKRDNVGTKATNQLRKEGLLPAVLYGHGEENVAFSMPYTTMEECIRRNIRILKLDFGDKSDQVLIKDLQWDTFGYSVLHVDFMRVRMDEVVSMVVAVSSTGRAKGIDEGGILDINRNEITVKCLPTNIPDVIEFDVSELGVGDVMHVRDLVLPEGVELDDDPEAALASVTARVAEVVEEPAAEGEGEEGEAPGEEGKPEEEGDKKEDDKGDG
jgi:large subunit ribosomal protein L25